MQLRIDSPQQIFMEDTVVIDRKRSLWSSILFNENENFPKSQSDSNLEADVKTTTERKANVMRSVEL
ncbi:hypothetical protein QE152_g11379 [Popillia japonica]|uniref:Uncharacterized protein n=1 Tax=Popillia japonica TaxID=7064 RepID=A0AAW1LRX4_POPJA